MARLSCAWALYVSDDQRRSLSDRERLGLDLAMRIADVDRLRRRGSRFARLHGRSEEASSDRVPHDLYGEYYATEEEAGEGPYCFSPCREHVSPVEVEDGSWFVPYICPTCGNRLRPRKPRADGRVPIPPRLIPARLGRDYGLTGDEVRALIVEAREAIHPGATDRGIRRKREPQKIRATTCKGCGDPLPVADRPVGRPREYCKLCSTPAARTARSRDGRRT